MNPMGETFLQQKNTVFNQSLPAHRHTKIKFLIILLFGLIVQNVSGILEYCLFFFLFVSTFSKFVLSISPQLATRLLAHKIQSPQEWEAMQALTVSGHPSEAHAAHVAEMHRDYEWKKSFQGFGDMHEGRWKEILQWSGQVPLSQWAHQSGFTQGNDSSFTED